MNITLNDVTAEDLFKLMEMFDERFKKPAPVKAKTEKKPKAKPAPAPVVSNRTLSKKTLADELGVFPQNITYWINKGCPCDKSDKQYFFNKEEVNEWRDKNIDKEKARKNSIASRKTKTPSEFSLWQKEMFSKIDAKSLDRGKACSSVFNTMTKKYGVVWDQVKKEFYHANGYPCRSTMQACHWLQTSDKVYDKMFDSILDGMVAA